MIKRPDCFHPIASFLNDDLHVDFGIPDQGGRHGQLTAQCQFFPFIPVQPEELDARIGLVRQPADTPGNGSAF
jgi:hypothetical protein